MVAPSYFQMAVTRPGDGGGAMRSGSLLRVLILMSRTCRT